ncbi:MAG: GTPase Era [Bacteroidetes bacterium]|nr:GTPase Era [Bacteroidota bacterium]
MGFKSGFVSIIGMPNAGKSTLYNALLGEKLSIVNAKAQTTRHRSFGIKNGVGFQIVFSDTPGILRETSYGMHERMMKFVKESVSDSDVLVLLIDINGKDFSEEIKLKFEQSKAKKFLVLNKIDKSHQQQLEEKLVWLKKNFVGDIYLAISALEGFQLDVLERHIVDGLPIHPAYYPEDQLTDKSERFFVNEIVRNNILKIYDEEVPYAVEVVTILFKEDIKIIRMSCEIIVERNSQKPIIIGKGGQTIKKLGIESRKELEQFFQKKIFIELFVKVREDWRNNNKMLDQFGYDAE